MGHRPIGFDSLLLLSVPSLLDYQIAICMDKQNLIDVIMRKIDEKKWSEDDGASDVIDVEDVYRILNEVLI